MFRKHTTIMGVALGRLSAVRRRIAATAAAAVGVGIATLLAAGAPGTAQATLSPSLPVMPTGAVRTLLLSNGNGEVYKTVQPNGDVCLTQTNAQGGSATACAHAAEAATYGITQIQVVSGGQYAPGITVLAPAGVTTVAFGLSDGTTSVVPVENAVAQLVDPRVRTAQYVLPTDGNFFTATVPPMAAAP